ncbi:lytic transglycosylase domain-containing protein [Sulfitobacter mediterraneus]|uniref:lytic transglycosylase domain-containing protein n=1 Tax=Sulfitobacter mediterraneus TaxID=83219 RepID=UPI001932E39C|nr:lytic transglycosylase domain-containing protein [Sulfitobacter mediterraneus]MBM1633241.1 lytic transglycosylase domain-containing protein [Sulfitobacter mediterraneus]MBM1640625.1 lytic transglycosylase domain-containing protein [Sulfitobacter mediterraneus]MBM1645106.1 lytic transglycosylase domain-containing protein [Sulfitobacter mediterraneus]MBM1648745.1 lytic transglycosylase domain-containing protein [Sulfitobacter mediterraneus]MBM1652766.1 lytic transglycosylase domain-containing
MQAMTRILTLFALVFMLAVPALAERPRPLAKALEAMRSGNWDNASRIAVRDGQIAADIITWHYLRAGRGTYTEIMDFLTRRTNWPGEAYLRKQSEAVVIGQGDPNILKFFKDHPPQTPLGVLAYAGALSRNDKKDRAEDLLIQAWQRMDMDRPAQILFLAENAALLKPHHNARLEALLWQRKHDAARRMFDLVSTDRVALAETRIALQRLSREVNKLIDALPPQHANDPGLQHDRFEWRIRKGLSGSAKELLLAQSTSAKALGKPSAWGNRRRALARSEMRAGNGQLAYQLASQHFLTEGSDYADLEWLSGYLALRFLKDPARAHQHFMNHDSAVQSPISQGRAGYWQGRALEAMGDKNGAQKAYSEGAKYQTSFYGLLAAERGGLPFDSSLAGTETPPDWRGAAFAIDPRFEAGILLQASGELSLAERFWLHLADELDKAGLAQLGQAAIDLNQPHLAVMIGKRAARRGLTIAAPYYPLHSLLELDLPMAPEMNLAIARRESEFDPVVVSHAGARGLMQLMPATARDVAADLGISGLHTTDRLTADPDHNAQLGATYLAQMAGRFDGNVSMVAAAYNAGPSRPDRWMAAYGDPRKGEIDIIDWVEMIPFRETQNYVMRVTESLPIYRARLGKDPLPIPFSEELVGRTLLPFAPKGE